MGPVRHARGARPCLGRHRAPAVISAPATAQDLTLLQTRAERISARRSSCWSLAGFPFIASPFELDLACQVFLASVGALSLMLLTGYAGQISLGHAGLIAAGAFTAGILVRGNPRAVLDDVAGRGA